MFQQYVCDQYSKIEMTRLQWVRKKHNWKPPSDALTWSVLMNMFKDKDMRGYNKINCIVIMWFWYLQCEKGTTEMEAKPHAHKAL
jgi:hypothetical protein